MKFNQVRFWLGIALLIVGVPWIRQGLGYVPTSVMNGERVLLYLGVGAIVAGLYLVVGVVRGRRPPGDDEPPR